MGVLRLIIAFLCVGPPIFVWIVYGSFRADEDCEGVSVDKGMRGGR